ncbi:LTA synthase family protein [Alkalihalobacillus pseudalcaliphilus]|uniref:LTA synthase family protein n=1 Tax=Alkalihalobacillus pseudalcaliphilus TaxID=79884 RepID=UPI000A05E01C|nr:LTA synthase family protein [Alkalihalobacillus pseudalcaliphilus]
MERIIDKTKNLLYRLRFFAFAVFFLWIKTYLVYKFGFGIPSDNPLQEFLLFINPLSSAIFILGISFFFNEKWRKRVLMILAVAATLVLYFNLLYYRFFTDYITIPVLFQTSNMGDLGSSVFGLIQWYDVFLFVDILLLMIFAKKQHTFELRPLKREPLLIMLVAVLLFVGNLTLAQAERPQLLTRSFDRDLIVKNIGIFNYHIYDGYIQSQTRAQRVFADSSDIIEVERHVKAKHEQPNPDLYGIAEGKNVIVISMESLQSFVINETVNEDENGENGQVITPFLNSLIDESIYFDNFYHQTGQGKTSDSEYLVANSMFGRDSGSVFFTHGGNVYDAMPGNVADNGYYASVMHANNKSFWNRDMVYQSFGYDKYFDIMSYDVHDENSVGWGLKDVDFFEQSIDLLKSQPEPYYTKFITLTNHFPFELDEEDKFIDEAEYPSRTLNRFFPTVRYMDHALEYFFDRLKEEGIYENSIFIMYGDHYGISSNHDRSMAMYLDKEEITPFDTVQLQRVPMYIHIPGFEGNKVNSTVSGQIDIKPTILHLLGIETEDMFHFGTDLNAPERDELVILRDGSFVTDDFLFTSGTCYDKETEQETELEYCEPYFARVNNDLGYSDKILFGDLLRYKDYDHEAEKQNQTKE